MISLVRVDDRLLHGQIICSWVPYLNADSLLVASDEAAADSLSREIISSCGCEGCEVTVRGVSEAVTEVSGPNLGGKRVILIVADLKDAMRVYDGGVRFKALNIGNLHHMDGGRKLSPSVIIDSADEGILERFRSLGVDIDIRSVPTGPAVKYAAKERREESEDVR